MRPETLAARFEAKCEWIGEHLIFTGKADTGNGYGKFAGMLAHRYAYRRRHELSPKLDVLHTCDIKRCVRDEHLYDGTNADNMRDKAERGHAAKGGPHNAGQHLFDRAFTRSSARDIKRRWEQGEWSSYREAGRQLCVSHHTIRNLVSGRYYAEVK